MEYNVKDIEKLIIYIQMEYCKMTLGDFIENENKNVSLNQKENSCEGLGVESQEDKESEIFHDKDSMIRYINIFSHIVKGIDFIHSHNNENMIHRDIKPNNILFSMDDKVKISDFGLATNSKSATGFLIPSPVAHNKYNKTKKGKFPSDLNLDIVLDNDDTHEQEQNYFNKKDFGVISPIHTDKNLIQVKTNTNLNQESLKRLQNLGNKLQKIKNEKANKKEKQINKKRIDMLNIEKIETKAVLLIETSNNFNSDNYHTKEIGTATYSAPEQLNNNRYDQKVIKL